MPFFLTPYLIHRLGSERYALYALASSVTGYLSLLDLGLGAGYAKYVAESAARGDDGAVNEVLSTGFFGYLGFGALLFAIWWPLRLAVVGLLGIGPEHAAEAAAVFSVAVLVLCLSGAAGAFRAVLYGLQHIDAATRIGVLLLVPKVVLTLAAVEAGLGPRGLVLADLVLFLAGSLLMAWASRSFFPALSLRPSRATRASFRRLLGYGSRLQVSRLSELVNFQLDKLLLSRFVGLSSVTEYDLASRVLGTARTFPLLLVNALVPAVSELEARGESRAIAQVTARTHRALLLTGLPLFALAAGGAEPLLAAWLGPGHPQAALAIRVLALGYLLNVVSGAFTSVTQGIARNDYQMRVALLALGLNAVLSLILVRWLGFAGVVAGTSASLVIAYLYADLGFRRLLRAQLGQELRLGPRAYLAPLAAGLLALAAAALVGALAGRPDGRLLGWAVVAGVGLGGVAAYALGLRALGAIDRRDRDLLRTAWRSLGRRGAAGA